MFIGIGLGINAIRADVAAAVLTPVNTGAPTFSPTTGKIGTSHTASGDTWDAYDEREYRVQVGGVTVSSSATYTPVGGDDGESMVGQVRARNTGGAWSAWASTAPLTVTYPAYPWVDGDRINGGTASARPADLINAGTASSRPIDLANGVYA